MIRQKFVPNSLFVVFFILFCFSIDLYAFDYVINDFNSYSVPNVPTPAKGVPFTDPTFHTTITRITDAATDLGPTCKYAQPGYPKHDIENADGTKLIIQSTCGSTWHIWNAKPPYNKICDIVYQPGDTGAPIDPRWDKKDPDVLYYTYNKKFWKFQVSTQQRTVLHDFRNEYPGEISSNPYCALSMFEEGDSSDDSRYWAFIVLCQDNNLPDPWGPAAYKAIAVYDKDFYGKDNGKMISTLNRGDPKWRLGTFSSMSPSGKYVWIGDTHYIWPRDFSSGPRNLGICCHADMAISAEGREVVFGFAMKYPENVYYAVMVDIETGELTYLAPVGSPRYHFSGNSHAKPGWGLVSTYGNDPTMSWGNYEAFMVELTKRTSPPPRVWRLAPTRDLNAITLGYSYAPFAKINTKGTKIFFGSSWGKSLKDPTAQYDVYQIDLPSTWYQDLMGNMPPTASISANPLSGKPPLTVSFMGSGKDVDGTITSYVWNFGDDTVSNQQNPSHTYQTPGNYTATLKVTDDKGAGGNANITINVLKSDTTPPSPPKGLKILK